MNSTSSTGEFARVGAVLSALFASPEREANERWGQTVARTVAAAVSAANAVLVVGFKHATAMYGSGVAQTLDQSYARLTPPDAPPLFVHPHTGVWCRRAFLEAADTAPSYDGVPSAEGSYDAVGITVPVGLPGARATVSCHHSPALSGAEVRRQTKVLELLRPAIAAGVRARIGAGREQTALTRLVDAISLGAALYSSDGTVLHQNALLSQLLAEDPERHRLVQIMASSAREVAARTLAVSGSKFATLRSIEETAQEVRTGRGRHTVRARVLAPVDGGVPGLVAVIVERARPDTPSVAVLRKQFCLTDRELDVTHLLAQGKSNADIARALGISPYTARHHTESVLFKLGVRSRAEVPGVVLGSPTPVPGSLVRLDGGSDSLPPRAD